MDVQQVRLGDVLELQRRKIQVAASDEYMEVGLRSFGKGIFHKPVVTGADLGDKKVYRIEPGDLVISNVFAWEGALAVASDSERGRIGSHRFMTWTPRGTGRVHLRYLWHYFLSDSGLLHLRRASPGSAGRNRTLGIAAFENIAIPLPSLPEQKRIADRLDRIHARQGNLLRPGKAIVPAVFRGALSKLLDRADKYWTVGEEIQVMGGGTPSKTNPDYWHGDIPWVTPTDLGRLRSRTISTTERTLSASGLERGGARLIPPNSVIMSSRAPIGHLATNCVSAATNQGCKSFVPQVDVTPEYLYFAVLSVMDEIKRRGSGTTFSEVSASKLLGLRIPAVESGAQQEVAARLARTQDAMWQITALQMQSSSLSSALLPAARNEEFTHLI